MYDTYKGMTKPTEFDFENNSGKQAEEEYKENMMNNYNNWCYASLEDVKKNSGTIGVFPVDDEDWIDVGQWAEYKQAIENYKK